MIEVRYLDKNGNGDEKGNYFVYKDAKSMEQAEILAKEMNKKGFSNVTIVDDGKENWETYKKWLKRSLDLTKMVEKDNTATPDEKIILKEKINMFQLCINKMEEMEKIW